MSGYINGPWQIPNIGGSQRSFDLRFNTPYMTYVNNPSGRGVGALRHSVLADPRDARFVRQGTATGQMGFSNTDHWPAGGNVRYLEPRTSAYGPGDARSYSFRGPGR